MTGRKLKPLQGPDLSTTEALVDAWRRAGNNKSGTPKQAQAIKEAKPDLSTTSGLLAAWRKAATTVTPRRKELYDKAQRLRELGDDETAAAAEAALDALPDEES